LTHAYITYSLFPLLALEFATVIVLSYSDAWPVLVTAFDTIPDIQNA
jgi:hypothetical protein